jgi:antitoxin ParD1/3/4
VRVGLRLLEEEEEKMAILKKALQEGLDSGIAKSYDPKTHLASIKKRRRNG